MKTAVIVASEFTCDKCKSEKVQSDCKPDGSFERPPKGWIIITPPIGFDMHVCPKCVRNAYLEGPNQ